MMKPLALAICALAGAAMAIAGTLAEKDGRRTNQVDGFGTFLAFVATGATIVLCLRRDSPQHR